VIVALFDGEGLKVSGSGALVGHRVYTGEIDARPTVRVSTDVLPPETEEERRASGGAPAPPAPPARPAATHAPSDVATTRDTAGQTRPAPSAKPAPAVPATRVSVGMLRLILGGIAAALALWLLLRNRS